MLNKVKITNSFDETLVLDLFYPGTTGVVITKIDGLYPVSANINTTDILTMDGGIFNSARISSRNILFYLNFMTIQEKTVEEIRQEIYRFFPVKERIKIEVEADLASYYIYGYVEKDQIDIFSKQESTQISVICPDPYFRSSSENVTILHGLVPLFQFPFANESLTEKEITFGKIDKNYGATVIYNGYGEVGLTIILHATGKVENISIFNLTTRETMVIDTDRLEEIMGEKGLLPGDTVTVSTEKGNKTITLSRNGIYTNIFNCVTVDSDWFPFRRGVNRIAYNAEYGRMYLQVTVMNEVLYDGI